MSGEESDLQQLESEWEKVQVQTNWKLEACLVNPLFRESELSLSVNVEGVSSQLPHHLEGSSSHSETDNYNYSHRQGHNYCHSHSRNYTYNSLSVLFFNARSILPKFDGLCSEVEIHKPDIICLVESWLIDEVLDSEISLTN